MRNTPPAAIPITPHAGLRRVRWRPRAGVTRGVRLSGILLPLVLAGCQAQGPTDHVRVSGHVEATEVRVAPEVGGRILELAVAEGDRVGPATSSRGSTRATPSWRSQRAPAERAQADAQLRLLRAGSRPEDIRQAEAQVEAAQADVAPPRPSSPSADADLERFEALLARQRRLAQAARRCADAAGRGARAR